MQSKALQGQQTILHEEQTADQSQGISDNDLFLFNHKRKDIEEILVKRQLKKEEIMSEELLFAESAEKDKRRKALLDEANNGFKSLFLAKKSRNENNLPTVNFIFFINTKLTNCGIKIKGYILLVHEKNFFPLYFIYRIKNEKIHCIFKNKVPDDINEYANEFIPFFLCFLEKNRICLLEWNTMSKTFARS